MSDNLFQTGVFTLHSGEVSTFKIDCDALTRKDLQAIALQLTLRLPKYGIVVGVPKGGIRLARVMESYRDPDSNNRLIVDDVYTTGRSMEEYKNLYLPVFHPFVFGVVIFARNPTPDWITPLFRMEK